jgi:hypothetical protein
MTNPYATAPQQAPATISDTAAQQFGAPAQVQQQAPNPFGAQQFVAAPTAGDPYGAVNQQMQQPQSIPGQPWTPQQHQQHGQQFAPQASAPAIPQQQAPAQGLQFGAPAFASPAQAQQSGPAFPAAATPTQAYDPAMFGQPSAGGGGDYPKVRDLDGRLCLFRVKDRAAVGTDYNDRTKQVTNFIVNVAVLDGGPLYSSPAQDDVTGQPTLVSETVPYVIKDMTIGQVGLQNRLKSDFVRGRVVRMPKGETEKQLVAAYPGMEGWQALSTWIAQDPSRVHQLKSGTFFWGIVSDGSPEADQLVTAFAGHPSARELMS